LSIEAYRYAGGGRWWHSECGNFLEGGVNARQGLAEMAVQVGVVDLRARFGGEVH
jgi:hypothetical protein